MKPTYTVTAEQLYINHRAILGGDDAKSAATGQPIKMPYLLHEAPPGVQKTHWGMACVVAIVNDTELPPRPSGVSEDDAHQVLMMLDIKQSC